MKSSGLESNIGLLFSDSYSPIAPYIPGSNMFPGTETALFKSSDDKYKYPGSVITRKTRILNKKKL
jgi:hypothetical protein